MSLSIDPPPVRPALRPLPTADSTTFKALTNNCVAQQMAWITTTYGAGTAAITDWGGFAEANLRLPAHVGFGLAVLVGTGTLDAAGTGYSSAAVEAQAIRLLTSLAATHKGNDPAGWGGSAITGVITPDSTSADWQGAFWVADVLMGARLLWADLSSGQRTSVQNMAVTEANRFIGYAVPAFRGKGGAIITSGDTKAEENSWNSWMLFSAAAVFPTQPNALQWLTKALELTISAGATPAAPTSHRKLNGMTVGGTVTGSNLELDGFVVNHGFKSPNYTSAISNAWLIGLMFAWLTGKGAAPTGCFYNGDLIYRSLVDVQFSGGTIYTPGVYNIYYPDSDEGDPDRMLTFAIFDAVAHMTSIDTLASVPAATWLPLHDQRALTMQATDSTRKSYFDLHGAATVVLVDWIASTTPPVFSDATPTELLA